MKNIKIIPSQYKYNKETYIECSIYKDGWCRFSPRFSEGCKEGRAMMSCMECKISDQQIIVEK